MVPPTWLACFVQWWAHTYETRSASSGGIQVPNIRTEMWQRAFTYRETQRWNSLPASIRAGKATAIRVHLLTHLLWPFCLLSCCMITGMMWPNYSSLSITSLNYLHPFPYLVYTFTWQGRQSAWLGAEDEVPAGWPSYGKGKTMFINDISPEIHEHVT